MKKPGPVADSIGGMPVEAMRSGSQGNSDRIYRINKITRTRNWERTHKAGLQRFLLNRVNLVNPVKVFHQNQLAKADLYEDKAN
jgi:hypothetical protein